MTIIMLLYMMTTLIMVNLMIVDVT